MNKVNFGIIGLGNIANKFASALSQMDNVNLIAVAARSKQRSLEFGDKFDVQVQKCYDNYQDLILDRDVNAIYIALPNNLHFPLTIECLENKKAVICEKPATLNANELEKIIACAQKNNTFYMEAMKTRFLPVMVFVKQLIDNQEIGQIKYIHADFGFNTQFNEENRLYNPQLGGGSLLDVGIYPISLVQFLINDYPQSITSTNSFAPNNVDVSGHVVLKYQNGMIATLFHSINHQTIRDAQIIGTKGMIKVPMFSNSQEAFVTVDGKTTHYQFPFDVNGMEYEINALVDALLNGEIETGYMSHADSLMCMKIIDEINLGK